MFWCTSIRIPGEPLVSLDIAAYLSRIGYSAPTHPTLDVLRALHARHPAMIPFESVDPFLGTRIQIDIDSIQQKLVRQRRGGYCQEHNLLFHDVLACLGFSVTALGGRVVWMSPGRDAPLTHRLTLIDLPEGRFIADVGFGAQSGPAPLRLETDETQVTSHGAYRIAKHGEVYELQLHVEGQWQPMYRFRLDAVSRADFEMANWYTCSYPYGRFTRNLVVARILETSSVGLVNKTFTIRHPDGTQQHRPLTGAQDLADVLGVTMAIDLPVSATALWERLPDQLVTSRP
jgi:N-hydroxyarylamine O-acetyltransferase